MRHITTHTTPATGLRSIADTSWHPRGACYGMDPEEADELFFPRPRDLCAIAEARSLCSRCPVRRDCLNHALENGIKEGTWGGLTKAERRPWHDGLPQRMDYSRVIAFFNGRDVHLTNRERQAVIDHAYVRGWRPARLAVALQISPQHARDLLRQVANKVFDRDRYQGIPRKKRKKAPAQPKTDKPPGSGKSAAGQLVARPLQTKASDTPLGKAA
ncbi:WhiB family transcriptional regulator [Streptomyces sp. IB2014 016-6]|uniref:WhiB family transcriptional regulator n=1 Tax=Streptomyces sp. IB2014 016-6 TaxID=2517818 RepID=UPI0011CAE541|nr:WhiB family transcriptional regulator [Streptomyces sp. IB2014 016-6]TXL83975.1 WhiB family transcriptional regulator [Streptomyces sp. IB2014 016-6]